MTLSSTAQAAKILGVSGATVRNWAKAGYLSPLAAKPFVFATSDLLALKERIRTNRFNRLRKRANKSAAEAMPRSAIDNPGITAYLSRLGEKAVDECIDPAHIVYCAALRYLDHMGEVMLGSRLINAVNPESLLWRRRSLRIIMSAWRRRLGCAVHERAGADLDPILQWRDTEDRLGIIHQSLSPVGKKARTGAYFTPVDIIDASLTDLGIQPTTFLDPCCGTGRYLIRAARKFSMDPHLIYGFDVDPVAVDIASINLLLEYPNWDFTPRVRCLDTLADVANGQPDCDTNSLLGKIDAVATNPPWGGSKNVAALKKIQTSIKSGESFSLFLEKSLSLLRPGGRLSFLLPESVLKIKAHTDIRKLLLEQTSILKVALMGRVFSDIFTPIMRLDVEKTPAPEKWQVEVTKNGTIHAVPQQRFAANAGHTFDIAVTPEDEKLLDKIFSVPHQTLRGQAEWALGIVTGDNARCVLHRWEEGAEPVLRGRDVLKFATREASCFIRFQPSRFQQVAPERIYRAPEKLIYRFVSNTLVFAYDNNQLLTLNSANIVIPKLKNMPIKPALAILNSRVLQYVFVKRFRTRKILRGDLETLPFPVLSGGEMAALEKQVDKCMAGDYSHAEELDRMVFRLFSLDNDDVQAIQARLEAEGMAQNT